MESLAAHRVRALATQARRNLTSRFLAKQILPDRNDLVTFYLQFHRTRKQTQPYDAPAWGRKSGTDGTIPFPGHSPTFSTETLFHSCDIQPLLRNLNSPNWEYVRTHLQQLPLRFLKPEAESRKPTDDSRNGRNFHRRTRH